MTDAHRDAGFVMLDALMAAALVALAGTSIVLIANGLGHEGTSALDRSVALVMSQSLMKQYLLVGDAAVDQLEHEDERFTYRIVADQSSAVVGKARPMSIVAEPKTIGGVSGRLDFLAPASESGP